MKISGRQQPKKKKQIYPHSLSSCELWDQRVWPPRPTLY